MDETIDNSVWNLLRTRMNEGSAMQLQKNDPKALAEKLKNRARILRGRAEQQTSTEIPLIFLAFHKTGERYGIPIDDVLEVQTLDQFTAIPRTPPFIPGVVHWRGAILALFDPGKFFGVAETGIADKHVCIIVEAAHRRIAVLTGEVDDILSVPRHEVKPPPPLPGDLPADWILGVHDENRLILRLDLILQDPRLEDWKNE